MRILNGYKTYIAAFGLFCLGGYQLSEGHFEPAYQSFLAGLATLGLRSALATEVRNAQEDK